MLTGVVLREITLKNENLRHRQNIVFLSSKTYLSFKARHCFLLCDICWSQTSYQCHLSSTLYDIQSCFLIPFFLEMLCFAVHKLLNTPLRTIAYIWCFSSQIDQFSCNLSVSPLCNSLYNVCKCCQKDRKCLRHTHIAPLNVSQGHLRQPKTFCCHTKSFGNSFRSHSSLQ